MNKTIPLNPVPKNKLPRWRGFNLIEKFKDAARSESDEASLDPVFGRHEPFRESDFQWIADWGFDFVRLPLSYHCWSSPERWLEMDEKVLTQVDDAVELGRRYGIHVCINLHRAPGYCVNPPAEQRSLWRDADALTACCHHWRSFARRYRAISSERLSFNLLNEPAKPGPDMTRTEHERVIRALTGAIREEDPARLIIADGLSWGNEPMPELADLGIAQSCRFYLPTGVTFYKAPWAGGVESPEPQWPGGLHGDEAWDRSRLEAHFKNWAHLFAQGIGVHCGEGGCFHKTPHTVFLAWLQDVLEILASHGIGHAFWNFRGPFGVLDSGRKDVTYKNWQGHSLDERMLTLLQKY